LKINGHTRKSLLLQDFCLRTILWLLS